MVANVQMEQAGPPPTAMAEGWGSRWPQSPAEIEAVIDAFQDRLVRYAFCRLRNLGEAEDVVQEVFVKAYTRRHELRNVYPVAPYLHRMVANTCIDRLRRPRLALVTIDSAKEEEMPSARAVASERLAAADQLKRAEEWLARLPKRQAEVVRLRVFDDLPLAEIASTLGCSLGTVKSRLRYAITKLRGILSREKERTP